MNLPTSRPVPGTDFVENHFFDTIPGGDAMAGLQRRVMPRDIAPFAAPARTLRIASGALAMLLSAHPLKSLAAPA